MSNKLTVKQTNDKFIKVAEQISNVMIKEWFTIEEYANKTRANKQYCIDTLQALMTYGLVKRSKVKPFRKFKIVLFPKERGIILDEYISDCKNIMDNAKKKEKLFEEIKASIKK